MTRSNVPSGSRNLERTRHHVLEYSALVHYVHHIQCTCLSIECVSWLMTFCRWWLTDEREPERDFFGFTKWESEDIRIQLHNYCPFYQWMWKERGNSHVEWEPWTECEVPSAIRDNDISSNHFLHLPSWSHNISSNMIMTISWLRLSAHERVTRLFATEPLIASRNVCFAFLFLLEPAHQPLYHWKSSQDDDIHNFCYAKRALQTVVSIYMQCDRRRHHCRANLPWLWSLFGFLFSLWTCFLVHVWLKFVVHERAWNGAAMAVVLSCRPWSPSLYVGSMSADWSCFLAVNAWNLLLSLSWTCWA